MMIASYIRTDEDRKWLADGEAHHWTLPPPAAWYYRLWGVRHIRSLHLAGQIDDHETVFRSMGLFPTGYDRWILYAIVRGWI
jgi:hypothetical protein